MEELSRWWQRFLGRIPQWQKSGLDAQPSINSYQTNSEVPFMNNSIPETADERAQYRTSDGSHDILFWFRSCGASGWQAYIMSEINYQNRDTSSHATHRIYDSELNLHYVCWSQRISTKAQCKSIAALWSDKTLEYIRTGRPI